MKLFWLLLLVLSSILLFAENRQEKLVKSIQRLDKALIQRDSVTLKKLLDDHVTYGHSNGWIEQKNEVINDLFNGKLEYKEIVSDPKPQITLFDKTGIVRSNIKVKVVVEGVELELRLHVLQAWVLNKDMWKLIGRQSVKVVN